MVKIFELGIADDDLKGAALHPAVSQPCGDLVCKKGKASADFGLSSQIVGKGEAVAYGFGRRCITGRGDRAAIQTQSVFLQLGPLFSQYDLQCIGVCMSQLSNGLDTTSRKLSGGGSPHIEQTADRERPDDFLKVFRSDQSGSVRFFQVAAQLGKDLVE